MKSPMPMYMVSDIQASIQFYQEALGFDETFTLPDGDGNIVHASVQNGETMIMFSPCTDDLRSTSGDLGKGVSLYLLLNDADDVDALFARAEAAGAKVLQTPRDEFWGDRVWSVADPDGYELLICKQVREVSLEDMTRAVDGMAAAV